MQTCLSGVLPFGGCCSGPGSFSGGGIASYLFHPFFLVKWSGTLEGLGDPKLKVSPVFQKHYLSPAKGQRQRVLDRMEPEEDARATAFAKWKVATLWAHLGV